MAFYAPRFADGPAITVPDYIVNSVPGVGGGSGSIALSNATTLTDQSSVGTVVGNFSIIGGSTRAYTFTLTNNPGGLFSVGGSTLSVAAALTAGTDPISARASDTGVSVITGSFNITVTSSAFVPTFELLGF